MAIAESDAASAVVLAAGHFDKRGHRIRCRVKQRVVNAVRMFVHEHPHIAWTGGVKIGGFGGHIPFGPAKRMRSLIFVTDANGPVHDDAPGARTPTERSLG